MYRDDQQLSGFGIKTFTRMVKVPKGGLKKVKLGSILLKGAAVGAVVLTGGAATGLAPTALGGSMWGGVSAAGSSLWGGMTTLGGKAATLLKGATGSRLLQAGKAVAGTITGQQQIQPGAQVVQAGPFSDPKLVIGAAAAGGLLLLLLLKK